MNTEQKENTTKTEQPSGVFSSEDMVSFGNFIRDNYYVAGTPKMLSYHPEKYPHGKIEDIFVYWSIENNK